jgi:hypothetical protein
MVVLLLQDCLDEVLLSMGWQKALNQSKMFYPLFQISLDRLYLITWFGEALRIVYISDETLSNEPGLSETERVGIGLLLPDSENIRFNLKGECFGKINCWFDQLL